jgi:WD40 repeat protein
MLVIESWDEVKLNGGHASAVRQVVFSPDGKLLVSGGEDSKVMVWNFARRERIATLTGHTDRISCIAFSPDGKCSLVSSHGDGAILVWDIAERQRVANFSGHSGSVRAVAFSLDGKRIASASVSLD